MIGHKLNGFTVIAAVRQVGRPNQLVIVGERKDAATGRPHEYVTARMPFEGRPREWENSMFTTVRADDSHAVRAYTTAVAEMLLRAGFDSMAAPR